MVVESVGVESVVTVTGRLVTVGSVTVVLVTLSVEFVPVPWPIAGSKSSVATPSIAEPDLKQTSESIS